MKKLEQSPLDLAMLGYLTQFDVKEPRPYRYITQFRKKKGGALVDRHTLKQEFDEINSYLAALDVNFATLMQEGYVILTEDPLDVNAMMVKLTTGMDLVGQFEFDFNTWIRAESVTGMFDRYLRE